MDATNLLVLGGAVVATVALLAYMRRSNNSASEGQIRDLISKGLLFEQQNDSVQAQLTLERALREIENSDKIDMGQQATCLAHLGNIYERLGQPEQAKLQFNRVLDNWRAQLQRNQLSPADIDYAMTNLEFGRGTLAVAEFYVDAIVVLREKVLPKGHTDLENSYRIGANLLRKAGYKEEANLLLERGGLPPG